VAALFLTDRHWRWTLYKTVKRRLNNIQRRSKTDCVRLFLIAPVTHLAMQTELAVGQTPADVKPGCTAPAAQCTAATRPQTFYRCEVMSNSSDQLWSTVPMVSCVLQRPRRCSEQGHQWTPVLTAMHCARSVTTTYEHINVILLDSISDHCLEQSSIS